MKQSELSSAQSTLLLGCNKTTDDVINFILIYSWAAATTCQYAAAINKYLNFLSTITVVHSPLPATTQQIYHFILWCSRRSACNVTSRTIRCYLTGLRMWHTLHDQPFPNVNPHRTRLLLKACNKSEITRPRRVRSGLTLQDVLDLSDALTPGNNVDLVIKAVILVGFWGLARLGELTLHPDHPTVFLRRKDVSFSADGTVATLRLRTAKTAAHGEFQYIRLQSQPNRLDPVNILHKVLESFPGSKNDPVRLALL